MRKLLSLSLAAIMVASMGTMAFAYPAGNVSVTEQEAPADNKERALSGVAGISQYGYRESDGIVKISIDATSTKDNSVQDNGRYYIEPGKTIYYPLLTQRGVEAYEADATKLENVATETTLGGVAEKIAGLYAPEKNAFTGGEKLPNLVTLADAVKSLTINTKYTLGNDLAESPKIVYKKFDVTYLDGDEVRIHNTGYSYMLAITMKDSTSTSVKDYAADITLKKTSGTDKSGKEGYQDLAFNAKYKISIPVKFWTIVANDKMEEVTDTYKIYDWKNMEGENQIDFDRFDGAYFENDITGQEKTLLKADAKFDPAVANLYPSANINFFNGHGATFNKIGSLHLPAEPGSFIYAVAADGSLSAVNATYDDGEEAFVIKTRTLGKYAISDKELDIAASTPASSSSEVTAPTESAPTPASEPASTPTVTLPPVDGAQKPNPDTGANA